MPLSLSHTSYLQSSSTEYKVRRYNNPPLQPTPRTTGTRKTSEVILTFSSKLPVYLDLVRCDLRDLGERDLELEVLLCRRRDLDQDLEDDLEDLQQIHRVMVGRREQCKDK